jgi:MFS family permease
MLNNIARYPLTTTIVLILVVLACGLLRNLLVRVIGALFEWAMAPLVILRQAALYLMRNVAKALAGTMRGLRSKDADDDEWAGWDVILPLIWIALGLVIGLADFYLVGLRLAAMLGVRSHVPSLGIQPDIFLAMLFFAVTAVFAVALPELRRLKVSRHPWSEISDDDRLKLQKLCFLCLGLTVAAAAALWLWGDLQRYDKGSPELDFLLPLIFWLLLVLPVVSGTAVAVWAGFKCFGAVFAVMLMLVQAILNVINFSCQVITGLLRRTAVLVVAVIDIPGRMGMGVINFLTQRAFPGLGLPEIVPEPVFGEQNDQPISFEGPEERRAPVKTPRAKAILAAERAEPTKAATPPASPRTPKPQRFAGRTRSRRFVRSA